MKPQLLFPLMVSLAIQAQTVTFNPPSYVCYKLPSAITIDGKITEEEWGVIQPLSEFQDIYENGAKPLLQTTVKMAYDDDGLYIAARMEEPNLWATFDKHDSPLYQENAFEFFIDPSNSTHNYLEYEVNAMGTEWDLFLSKPYRDSPMIVMSDWEFMGMKSKVFLSGTLNNPADKDEYWSVEIFIPWRSVYQVTNARRRKPAEGDQMRVNFQRVEWPLAVENGKYVKIAKPGESRPQSYFWLWASQGNTGTSHAPEYWGYVQFTEAIAGSGTVAFSPNPDEEIRNNLRNIYYRQKEYFRKNKAYATTLADLKAGDLIPDSGNLKLYNTPSFYEVVYPHDNKEWHLSQDGLIYFVEAGK